MIKYLLLFLSLVLLGQRQAQAQTTRGLVRVSGVPSTSVVVSGPASNTVTITVTFASSPTTPTATFAALKYNKLAWFQYERDDLLSATWNDYIFFRGGTATDGRRYTGKTFTDGCGNKISWRASLVANAKSNFNNEDLWDKADRLTTAQVATMVKTGKWGILNHGYYHELSSNGNNFYPPVSSTLSQASWDIIENQKFTYQRLLAQGVQYLMRCVVIPSTNLGFTRGADSLQYLGVTSTNALDGYDGIPKTIALNTTNGGANFAQEETMPMIGYSKFSNTGFVQYMRNFQDSWSSSVLTTFKAQFADMLANCSNTKHLGMRIATHTATYPDMSSFFDYADALAADRVWFVGMTEQLEYREVKRLAQKTQSLNGNVLTITIDLSAVPAINRFRDMSLIVTGGPITSVSATGCNSYSFNLTTGLVNVFTEKTTGLPVP